VVTLTLAPTRVGDYFRGWLVQSPTSGVITAPSLGQILGTCGVAHTDSNRQTALTMSFVPPNFGTSVTITVFIIRTTTDWYTLTTVFQLTQTSLPPVRARDMGADAALSGLMSEGHII
jgi:hypothetical protein